MRKVRGDNRGCRKTHGVKRNGLPVSAQGFNREKWGAAIGSGWLRGNGCWSASRYLAIEKLRELGKERASEEHKRFAKLAS